MPVVSLSQAPPVLLPANLLIDYRDGDAVVPDVGSYLFLLGANRKRLF